MMLMTLSSRLTIKLSRRLARLRGDERAGAMVEFLMVLPVFTAITFGTIEATYSFVTYSNMSDAARVAARELSLGLAGLGEAEAMAQARLPNNHFEVVASDPAASGPCDVSVQVSLPAEFATATNIGAVAWPDLTVTVTMRREGCV